MKVLYIDDHSVLCRLFEKKAPIHRPDLKIFTACTVKKAIEIAKENPDICVVIMDGVMSHHPDKINLIKTILGSKTEYIGASCNNDYLVVLRKHCHITTGNKNEIIGLIRKHKE